jgi:DNA primase
MIHRSRELNARDVVERLHLEKARERKKWECPACGSSDALHVYDGAGRGAHCFSCAETLDAIALVTQTLRIDFRPAVRWLADEFGYAPIESAPANAERSRRARKMRERKREAERAEKRRTREIALGSAREVWRELWDRTPLGPAGREYLAGRGLDPEMCEHVGIGSVESPARWSAVREHFDDDRLAIAGLLGANERGAYPVPWRSPFLIIPFWGEDGLDIIRFRDLTGDAPKYMSPLGWSPTVPYLSWGSYTVERAGKTTLFVCEGELNALSVLQADELAVSGSGAGIWRPDWSEPFRKFHRVIVLCDGDDAGDEFARRVAVATAEACGRDWTERHLTKRTFKTGMDANDALLRGELQELINVR